MDHRNCPVCYEHIEDTEEYRTPDLTESRFHPECWDEASNNKGQGFDHRLCAIYTCTKCRKTFDYQPKLDMGVTYCMDCAPEGAVNPSYS